jgi:hypothetical protein
MSGKRYKSRVTTIREDKPLWSAVPGAVRDEAERIARASIVRAVRAFGGYGPSATFTLYLDDGRRAFFKGVYPLPEGSGVVWRLDEEERVYEELGELIKPWAPDYYGAIREQGWHALLIEAVKGARVPPWTRLLAERATRSVAEFHASTVGRILPDWLSREYHLDFADYWHTITSDEDALRRLAATCTTPSARRQAIEWVQAHGPAFCAAEQVLRHAQRFALLHFDTRSDNIRIDGATVRIFDWPFACVGPPEFDFAAYAQSVAVENGPSPEMLTAWYSDVLTLDGDLLTASIVGIAGFFAERGSQPEMPELPRLRGFQRRQFKASMAWSVRRLGLPEAGWLAHVAD